MSTQNGRCVEIVRRDLLEALAAEAPEPTLPMKTSNNGSSNGQQANSNSSGDYRHRLLVDRWLQERGIEFREKPQPDGKGRKVFVLKKCPFDSSHGDPDSCIMQAPNGALSAQCFHSSCGGRGWQQFKEAIGKPDGEHYDPPFTKKSRARKGQKASYSAPAVERPEEGEALEAFNDPHLLAREYRAKFRASCGPDTFYYHRQEYHRWDGRAYRKLEEKEVRAELTESIKDAFNRHNVKELAAWLANGGEGEPPTVQKVTQAVVGNSLQALSGMALLPGTIEPPAWLIDCDEGWDAKEMLACRNALVHLPSLSAGLPTSSIRPTPIFFSPMAVDYDFDPAALKPVNWLAFLELLWHGDLSTIQALQEWFGYCLLPDTSQQKILLLIGPKRSGKGTIARILRALIGIQNTASPTLASLGTNFGLQPLLHKTLAIISDARLSHRTDAAVIVERLLSISGEDDQTIDRKYLPSLTLRLLVRFMILTNELPKLNDPSGALVGRMILLRMTESFYGREDTALTATLLRELPGILLWAIEGWKRLRERSHFLQPDSGKRIVEQLEDLSSPINSFLRECCQVAPGFTVPCHDLYDRWKNWCDPKGHKPGTDQTFGRDLRAAVPGLDTQQPRCGSMRIRVYVGIRIRQSEDESGGNSDS